jgi:hypothetical protein
MRPDRVDAVPRHHLGAREVVLLAVAIAMRALTAPLQPRDEEVRALELIEPGRRIGAIEHAVAELGRERAEHRGAVRARELVRGERREDLAAQVVGDEARRAAVGSRSGRSARPRVRSGRSRSACGSRGSSCSRSGPRCRPARREPSGRSR